MERTLLNAIYDDEESLLHAVEELKVKGVKIVNVYSPFPVHGIDPLIGIKRTRLSIAAFIYGAAGTATALLMMWYMMVYDWPAIIGGKPNFTLMENLPSFIPVTFEMTVLFAAHGMFLTYLIVSRLLPGIKPYVAHPRVTDDKFVLQVETNPQEEENLNSMLHSSGAIEVNKAI